jgi:hypothetical protein
MPYPTEPYAVVYASVRRTGETMHEASGDTQQAQVWKKTDKACNFQ